jgi:dihydrofolate reductase
VSEALAPLGIIVAMSRNRVIGRDGGLPWHIPEDLKHFKRITTGHAIIMGRRTHESIGRPLPNRRNLVVSRREGLRVEGCEVFGSLDEAIARARETDAEPIVIGGAEIYAQALPRATRIHLTLVDRDVEGDVKFPEFDRSAWREIDRRDGDGVTWLTLERA